MNRLIILPIVALMVAISALVARAQTWTLDSCVAYALEHNISLKMRQVQQDQAQLSVSDAKARFLPNVSAGLSQSWNLGRGLTSENIYADRNTSSFSYSANLQLPVFDGMRTVRQIAYAKANLSQITEQYEAAKEDITLNVITSYLQVLYDKELCQVQAQQVSLSEYELHRRQALVEAGKVAEADLLDAISQLETDRMNLTQAENNAQLALLDLAQLLQLPSAEGFDIAPLADEQTLIIPAEVAYERALQHNHTIQAARRGITAADSNVKLAQSGYLPSLSFSAGLGSSYYKVSGFENAAFGTQMRNNYSTYFGLSLNIPIFDGLTTPHNVRRARMEQTNAQLELDQAEQQLYRAIQQAYYQAVGAEKKLTSTQAAERAAAAAFDSMQEKYNLGRATPSEYEQAKTKALTTQAELIQARYELILRSRLLQFYAEAH